MYEKVLWILKKAWNEDNKPQKLKLLTKEQKKSYENAKICYTCKGRFENKYFKYKKNMVKLETIVIMQGNIEVLRLAYVI